MYMKLHLQYTQCYPNNMLHNCQFTSQCNNSALEVKKKMRVKREKIAENKPFQTLILNASAESPCTYSPKYLRSKCSTCQQSNISSSLLHLIV